MRRIIDYMKSNIWIIYVVIFIVMLYKHSVIQLGTNDDVWFLEQSKMGIEAFTKWRMNIWTSRNIIEATMLILLNLNKWVWIVLDSLMFVLIAHSLRKIVSPAKVDDIYMTLIIAFIVLLFPFSAFSEAGWYATTLNYVWPLAFGLYGLSYITRIITKENITIYQKILVALGSVYAINQEQMCALFVGFYGLFIIYCFVKHIHVPIFIYVIILLSLFMLGYHALCPGNANRKLVEIQQYYPEYSNFNTVEKLVLGILTTISIGMLQPLYIVFIWNIVLLFMLIKKNADKKDIFIILALTIVNLIISMSDRFHSLPILNQMWKVFAGYSATVQAIDFSQLSIYISIGYFIVFIFINLFIVRKYLGQKIFVIIGIVLTAAFCSRVLLGFSASVFISGRRTFINSYFLIIIASLSCLNYKRIRDVF